MKRFLFVFTLSFFMVGGLFLSCSDEEIGATETQDSSLKTTSVCEVPVELPFQKIVAGEITEEIEYFSAKWKRDAGRLDLISDELSFTNGLLQESRQPVSITYSSASYGGGKFRGYFFDNASGCWYYGTLWVDSNTGFSIFVPASTGDTWAYDPICPPGDDEWC